MNATVARIVEIMFQNTEMSDEVQALKDEVMNNCQERYQDMIARGMDEDEAIAAVVDSLKGMEEVIAQYPRKVEAADPEWDEDEEDLDRDVVFAASMVKRVKVLLTSDDVNIESSNDEYVHVYYNKDDVPNLKVDLVDGLLKIERDNKIDARGSQEAAKQAAQINVSKEAAKQVKIEVKNSEGEWESLSDLFRGVGKLLNNIKINFGGGDGDVTIALPDGHTFEADIHTTSGDVDIDEVCLSEVMVESTSGDTSMTLADDVCPRQIKVKGSSGDVDITAKTASLTIQTVSGDVTYDGECPSMTVTTISGDAEISGVMKEVFLKSVSGDIDLKVEDDSLQTVNCNTTSGDLVIHLPGSLRGQVGMHLQTVSGDRCNRFGEPVGAPKAYVNARSVSGDVTLC